MAKNPIIPEVPKESKPQITLKYAKEVAETGKTCTENYKEMDIAPAYRWTFSEITNVRNFLPRAADPNNPRKEHVMKKCEGWSLSLFITQKQAEDRLRFYLDDKPNLNLVFGTHVAEGNIEKKDGLNGEPNNKGHFEHLEYDGIDLAKKFKIISQVYKPI